MAPFPPAEGETAEEIGDDDAQGGVDLEVVGDPHVASIVRRKHELVPEEAHQEAGGIVPARSEGPHAGGKQEGVSSNLAAVCPVVAVVEPGLADASLELPVLLHDFPLPGRIQRRVLDKVVLDPFAGQIFGVEHDRAAIFDRSGGRRGRGQRTPRSEAGLQRKGFIAGCHRGRRRRG